jgi:V/A-type H+-transporting ATPase subunit D
MAEIKLTKTELRSQQVRLAQLRKYLPTLQLKKAMLQAEVNEARLEIEKLEQMYQTQHQASEKYSALLTMQTPVDPMRAVKIREVKKRYDNIAGVEVPYFEGIDYDDFRYSLVDTPAWFDSVVSGLRDLTTARIQIKIVEEKKRALEEELRQVSIRVNLFEKILIPRAVNNIKKIQVFLGDQQLAAVGRAKVAKTKIEERKQKAFHAP